MLVQKGGNVMTSWVILPLQFVDQRCQKGFMGVGNNTRIFGFSNGPN